ncbi:unnamed protein product [Durusdinium trenchii]|uniref:Uncharacterized protein n=1 Tax=Durusdinium trenchii TaxID=1381693 RepID=A0ABP0K8K8_9DINO
MQKRLPRLHHSGLDACPRQLESDDPFDCQVGLRAAFHAWSPLKKQWCCWKEGRGCERTSLPGDHGDVGKHVQVNDSSTWQVSGQDERDVVSICNAGMVGLSSALLKCLSFDKYTGLSLKACSDMYSLCLLQWRDARNC